MHDSLFLFYRNYIYILKYSFITYKLFQIGKNFIHVNIKSKRFDYAIFVKLKWW